LAKFLLSHDINILPTLNKPSIDPKISNLITNNVCENFLLITPEFDVKKQTFKDLINVEAIRKINDFLQKTGYDNRYKIIIIDAADNLNINASNALLKNLEEPTKNTLFFLISHSYNNLLDTIKSRCINLPFKGLNTESMLNILNSSQISYTKNNINDLITLSQGSYTDLLWYLEENNFKIYESILKIFAKPSSIDIFNFVNSLKSQENFNYSYVFAIIKNTLLLHNQSEEISEVIEEINYLEKTSNTLYLDKSSVLLNILFRLKSF
jgi:DNA polymerase-3 subunit delta'